MIEPDLFEEKGFAGKPIDHCLVIDAHGHLGEEPTFPIVAGTPESIVGSMDRMGIDVFCVSSYAAVFGDASRGNRLVAQAMEDYPGRFQGYAAVDIGYPERILPELERCLRSGFKGVKIWSTGAKPGSPYSHPNYRAVFEFADAHHLPVLAHTWGGELDDLEPIIQAHPDINWLLAHTASQQKEKYIRFGKDLPNVYLETCFSRCPRGLIEELVAEGLADKVIWGTDTTFFSAAHQLGRILFAQISPEDKEKILGLNAQRALRL